MADPGNGDMTDPISNWISYVGANYKNLKELTMTYDGLELHYHVDETRVLDLLETAMSNLTQINHFTTNFCAPSESIIEVMDRNDIQFDLSGPSQWDI